MTEQELVDVYKRIGDMLEQLLSLFVEHETRIRKLEGKHDGQSTTQESR